jgi:hypothetical protein
MAKLIMDIIFDNSTVISESRDGTKELFIEGIFLQAEKKNRNGRIYPIDVLKPVVEKYIDNYVTPNRAMGELNHPTSPSVDPKNASHLITSLKLEGHDYIGKAKILNTPVGNIVRGLIEGGVNLGVSSRGLGSLKEGTGPYRGSKVVNRDYHMVTVDIVSDPSAPDAFVNGVYESVDYVIEAGVIKPVNVAEIKKVRNLLYKKKLSEAEKIANAQSLMATIIKFSE